MRDFLRWFTIVVISSISSLVLLITIPFIIVILIQGGTGVVTPALTLHTWSAGLGVIVVFFLLFQFFYTINQNYR